MLTVNNTTAVWVQMVVSVSVVHPRDRGPERELQLRCPEARESTALCIASPKKLLLPSTRDFMVVTGGSPPCTPPLPRGAAPGRVVGGPPPPQKWARTWLTQHSTRGTSDSGQDAGKGTRFTFLPETTKRWTKHRKQVSRH